MTKAMQNAHLRLGLLEFVRITEKTSTRIRVRVDRYIGEDGQAHLVSVFGNDSDIGAITAAVHEKASFSVSFPDGETKEVSLGEKAACYRGSVSLPGRKHPVRHLVTISQDLYTNGSAGRTILMRYRPEEAWAILVSFLGLPAVPEWADSLLQILESEGRITEIDGIGCRPVVVRATTEEVLDWIGGHLRSQVLTFPDCKGTIGWPLYSLSAALTEETTARLG
jgi:hypothetical protein